MHAEASKNEEQEEEYMDPMGSPYEDISHDTINTVIQKPAYALSIDGHAYYGLAEVLPDAENNILDHDVAVLPHYQVDQAWAAVNNGEAALSARGIHHKPAYTTCDLLEHNVDVHASTNKRPAPLTISGDSDVSEVEIVQPKRRHNPKQAAPEPSPAMVPVEEADNEEIIDEQIRKSQRKTSNKTPWTRPESELLVARRDSGKTWDEVHVVSIYACCPTHSTRVLPHEWVLKLCLRIVFRQSDKGSHHLQVSYSERRNHIVSKHPRREG